MLETGRLPKVAVVIPTKDEGDSTATMIRALKTIPRADLSVVIDSSSSDNTGDAARSAGVVVVRHSVNRGKTSVTGAEAKAMTIRDSEEDPACLILFLGTGLGDSVTEAYPLVKAVISDEVDCAIANLPEQAGTRGHGFVTRLAQSAIRWAAG